MNQLQMSNFKLKELQAFNLKFLPAGRQVKSEI